MKLAPLIAIELVAFLLIIGETYFFFNVVVPLGTFPHNPIEYTGRALVKVGLTFGLGLLWLFVMVGLTRIYVRSRLRPSPSPSS